MIRLMIRGGIILLNTIDCIEEGSEKKHALKRQRVMSRSSLFCTSLMVSSGFWIWQENPEFSKEMGEWVGPLFCLSVIAHKAAHLLVLPVVLTFYSCWIRHYYPSSTLDIPLN